MPVATNVKRDYYEVLSVQRGCGDQELKSAYRKLALQFHPDRNPDDPSAEERFKEASEAYGVLSDPQKRAAYDRFGHAGVNGGGGFGGFDMNNVDLGDIFGDLFGDFFNGGGQQRRRSRAQRGADLRFDLHLEFEEAVFGVKRSVTVSRHESCEVCHATGAAPGTAPTTCPDCAGRGQVRFQQGFFAISRPCGRCGGTGSIIADPCRACRGHGRLARERTLDVQVPAGVEDGTRIRYSEQGEAGLNGGPQGDLYIVLHVKEHEIFEREGNDLHCAVPISFPQAALGAEIIVPTLYGEHKLKVPEGTQSGHVFRIRHKGVPVLNSSGKGDLFVEVQVQVPSRLNKRQRELLEELSATVRIENRPSKKGLLSKVKDIFV